ncbi:MAG: Cysteine desulfurase activator SufB [Candidatus Roizmanbacteria bacterium GW2011_GWA2_33_33]|uniref:Cysteine desulfurase activator SufB n=2 Tax=Candidatus Roizmaniibacteriota TaxID=1752723 RepID=A0A0G0E661_9BACT|nr:MAG: Cysteine desulfurase activator SufB [Candidatus Roizmanbacteria bacterium GW2011_GWA2_33_33]KKP62832.1 MAG: Cysteine desulfurase activator SufB [Candidatus Roizmanbacteria bacterium GW2011_GWC2_34_23]
MRQLNNETMKNMQFINLNETKKTKLEFNKPGDYLVFFHNLSGEFDFNINSSGVNLDILGLFVGKKSDNFKLKTNQYHIAPGSTSNLLIKGVFDDQSKFIYQGLIKIEKTGQKSHAYQKNKNLILSEKVYIDSRPFLEILANDVFCTHGSTTGKINEESLFYLKSRGLDQKIAEQLYVSGFIQEIIDKIKPYKVSTIIC